MEKIKILIVGFGNIGQCVLNALPAFSDMECVGIVTRDSRRVAKKLYDEEIHNLQIFNLDDNSWQKIPADVAILCGGSKNDLPVQGPLFAKFFNTVCSFDTHAKIDNYQDGVSGEEKEGYYHVMDRTAGTSCHTAMVCQGWDPGIFSRMRILFTSCLGDDVKAEAFYGLTPQGGLSMGHSDALRTIEGVEDARQYTHARPEAIELMRSGVNPKLTPGDMHWRECFVVAKPGANNKKIKDEILSMPNYFEPFHTTVNFVKKGELKNDMPHDGLVLAVAEHGFMEFRNEWQSNPQCTAGILLAYARAAFRFNTEGKHGAFVSPEVPDSMLLRNPKDILKFI
jgi:diaminopimelate dehydrogenase